MHVACETLGAVTCPGPTSDSHRSMPGTVMPCARTHSQRPESCIRCNMPELLSNQLLILAQRPDATTVAGYRAWQSLGRQVRRGATGIGIFGYSTKTSVQDSVTARAAPQPTSAIRAP